VPERDPLRDELAHDDVEVRHDEQREQHREEGRHHRVEASGEHLLAEGADRQAGDRDAELHRGDEPRRVARDAEDGAGAAVALVLELHDACAPRGHEPVFRRDEERVQQDQAGESEQFEEEGHRERLRGKGARVLGGRSSSTRISRRSIAGCATDRTYVL
jgi:hypothetical protein